jgi:hypothetical protein
LIRLEISSKFQGNIGLNIALSCPKFVCLREFKLYGDGLPTVSDEELLEGLRVCSGLEMISLCPSAFNYNPGLRTRLTLGCVRSLLEALPQLHTIEGCFHLEILSPNLPAFIHPKIRRLHLGNSYFLTVPPISSAWVATVGYLASFF